MLTVQNNMPVSNAPLSFRAALKPPKKSFIKTFKNNCRKNESFMKKLSSLFKKNKIAIEIYKQGDPAIPQNELRPDLAGQIVRSEKKISNNIVTTLDIRYNKLGQLTEKKFYSNFDSRGHRTLFEYDDKNRITRMYQKRHLGNNKWNTAFDYRYDYKPNNLVSKTILKEAENLW